MIRTYRTNDLAAVMQIWLDTNIKAHSYISREYWIDNYPAVKDALPRAEVYVYEDDSTGRIEGFLGMRENYIEGLFVRTEAQSRGIGKCLLDHGKKIKSAMTLSVYQKNTRAIKFYQRERFSICAENLDDNTGEKEFIMTWRK